MYKIFLPQYIKQPTLNHTNIVLTVQYTYIIYLEMYITYQ